MKTLITEWKKYNAWSRLMGEPTFGVILARFVWLVTIKIFIPMLAILGLIKWIIM